MIHLLFIICLSVIVSAQEWKDYQFKTGCRLFNLKGEVLKSFPGDICLYFDDGKLLTATDNGLDLYEPGFKHLWNIPVIIHHGLALSNDKKKILAMGSEFVKFEKNKKRIDKLMVIDLSGKILHQVLSTTLFKQAGAEPLIRQYGQHDFEATHFNSIFEIPAIKIKTPLPYLKEGNFIVNGREDGLFILSPDLQKVEFFTVLPQSVRHQVHDAQVLENGHLLIFNNVTLGSTKDLRYSSIQEIDFQTNEVVFEFTTIPKTAFFSSVSGAVQKLDDDHYLISHSLTGTFVYSKNKKTFVVALSQTHYLDGRPFPAHKVRLYDLRKFLSYWK
jgi:hypothetical protein